MNPLLLVASIVVSLAAGYFFRQFVARNQLETAESKAKKLLDDTRTRAKELLIENKDKALKIIEEAKQEEREVRKELNNLHKRLEQRETVLDKKLLDLDERRAELEDQFAKIDHAKEELKNIREQQQAKLEKIAGLSRDEAQKVLIDNVEKDVSSELESRVKKLQNKTTEEWEQEAKKILATAMERCAASQAVETTQTSVSITSDEMKGRIIGREGRNIKAIEKLTGVEIIVDDTPDTIFISGYSPIRRQVAKLTLDKLILDGRIHPGRIEDAMDEAKKELSLEIKKAGEEACYEVGVAGLDPKLVQILGRLKYRTSYGHNVLRHSIEVGLLSGLIADELGADVSIARKGGLLHDIGKAVDHEVQGGHPQIGYDIMKKFNLPEEVAYISIAHHEDHPKTIEGSVVKAADAISGARPGARKDTYEQYVQRLEELEKVAESFEGVEKTFAIYAGREVRVFVTPTEIDDWAAQKLARDIANKIEQELRYPGDIKVTVIRETRVTEYAR